MVIFLRNMRDTRRIFLNIFKLKRALIRLPNAALLFNIGETW